MRLIHPASALCAEMHGADPLERACDECRAATDEMWRSQKESFGTYRREVIAAQWAGVPEWEKERLLTSVVVHDANG